jgi:hypothetical protein
MLNTAIEQFTGLIDLIFGILLLILVWKLFQKAEKPVTQKLSLWLGALITLAFSSFLGFVVHFFFFVPRVYSIVWQPLYLSLGVSISFFVLAIIAEMKKELLDPMQIVLVLAAPIVFFTLTLIFPGSFLIFVIYESLALLFCLISLLIFGIRQKSQHYFQLFFAFLIFILSIAFQAMYDVKVLFVVSIDPNGLIHLSQLASLPLFYLGISKLANRT